MGRRTGTERIVVATVGDLGGRLLQGQTFRCGRPAVLIAASPAMPLYPLPVPASLAPCFPRPCSAASSCVACCTALESWGPHKRGTGAWCPPGTRLQSLRRSLVTFPGSASPDSAASSCSITSYSWNVVWACCFDRRLEFLFPLTSSAQKCGLAGDDLGDKGTGQLAHS